MEDFVIDILLGSPHMDIRLSVVDQLYQLCQTINTGGRGDEEGEGRGERGRSEGRGEERGEEGGGRRLGGRGGREETMHV